MKTEKKVLLQRKWVKSALWVHAAISDRRQKAGFFPPLASATFNRKNHPSEFFFSCHSSQLVCSLAAWVLQNHLLCRWFFLWRITMVELGHFTWGGLSSLTLPQLSEHRRPWQAHDYAICSHGGCPGVGRREEIMAFGLTSRSFSTFFPWSRELLFHFKLSLVICWSTWRKEVEDLRHGPIFLYRAYFCLMTREVFNQAKFTGIM